MVNKQEKRVLVLSGGGSRGAFQVGVLKKLVENGLSWDSVHGISAGSLNGLFVASYNKDELKEKIHLLENAWAQKIKGNRTLYRPWLPLYLNYPASFFIGSLYSTAPLKKFLYQNYNLDMVKGSEVNFYVGAVCLNDGTYCLKNKHEVDDIIKWVLASSSFPLAFSPVKIEGKKFVDGGLRNLTPFQSAINEKPDVIDVILTRPISDTLDYKENFKTNVSIGLRTIEVMIDEIFINDLRKYCDRKDVKINIYEPSKHFNYQVLDFNHKNIVETIRLGYEETIVKQ
jgi:NTE family protein